jgi:hypothetical protein
MTTQKLNQKQENNAVKRSISITRTQDRWLRAQKISLSKLVQEAIDNYMAGRRIVDSHDGSPKLQ